MADSDEAKKGFRPEDDAWLKSQYEKDQPPPPRVVPPPDPVNEDAPRSGPPRVDKEVGDRHFTPDGRVMTSDEVRRMTMTPTQRVNREQQMRRLTRQEQQEALEKFDTSEYEE